MRKAILWIIGIAAVVLVATRTAEIITLADTVRTGSVLFLLLAIVFQFARYWMFSVEYSEAFKAVREKTRAKDFLALVFGSVFVNTIMPTGGTAGPLLVIDDSRKKGIDVGRATSAVFLTQFTYFGGFAIIMVIGFIILESTHHLQKSEFIAGVILLGIMFIFMGILLLAKYKPGVLQNFFHLIDRLVVWVCKIIKKDPPTGWVESSTKSLNEACVTIWGQPVAVLKVLGSSVAGHFFGLLSFAAVGFAFGFTNVPALIAGYVVGILLMIISFVPQGVGIVEAGVALLLTSYGVNASIATAISLVYRGIIFWFPLALGGILLRRTESFNMKGKELEEGTRRFTGRLAAILVLATGGLTLALALQPVPVELLSEVYAWLPLRGQISATAAILAGLALVYVARGLWKRRKTALRISVGLLVTTSLALLFMGQYWQSVAMPLLFAFWLFTERKVFDQESAKASGVKGLWAILIAVGGTALYGTIGFWLFRPEFSSLGDVDDAFRLTTKVILDAINKGELASATQGEWFLRTVYIVGFVSIFGSIIYAIVQVARFDYEEWKEKRQEKKKLK